MKPGQTVRFQSLPVGAVFSCPDPSYSPLRVKLNETSAGDYPPGPMGPGQPSYHFTGLEWCLVRERRTGVEDRRVKNEARVLGHARANSGRRTGDPDRFIARQAAGRTHRGDALEFGLKVEVGPELRATMVLGEINSLLDSHYGPFRTFGIERMPDLVRQIIEKRNALGHELSAQQARMAAVRSALNLPIGDPVEAIRDLQAKNRRQAQTIDDRQTYQRGLEAALEAETRNVARLSDDLRTAERDREALQDACKLHAEDNAALRHRLQQTEDRMWRERQRERKHYTVCPWKFENSSCFGTGKRLGRTTRMLDAAIELMFGDHKQGRKVLVCGAPQDVGRLVSECEKRMRERGYFGLTVRTRSIENAIGGLIRFAVLPPPVQVDRVERDLERGDIFVDHFAVERLFSILTETDGRSTAMLRLAYPNLAKQLDR